jgi:hypothetical protein
MVRAALHVHSTYSDGEFTLPELREKFMRAGCRLVAMADHANYFDADRIEEYERECERNSDDSFVFLPGLEFGCVDRMHIVGYGVTALIDSKDPEAVIAHIRAHGGVAVIAHPPEILFSRIESFRVAPHGIEAWNSKYDGRYAPRAATFELIARLRGTHPSLRAFYGQDLHWRRQYAGLFTDMDAPPSAGRVGILAALADGAFEGVKETIRLPSDGVLSERLSARFRTLHARSRRFRESVKTLRRLFGTAVRLLPTPVKAQLRRLF